MLDRNDIVQLLSIDVLLIPSGWRRVAAHRWAFRGQCLYMQGAGCWGISATPKSGTDASFELLRVTKLFKSIHELNY